MNNKIIVIYVVILFISLILVISGFSDFKWKDDMKKENVEDEISRIYINNSFYWGLATFICVLYLLLDELF